MEPVVTLREGERIRLTTYDAFNTCIYVSCNNGKLVFEGGSSLVSEISGPGYKEKVK